MGSIPFSLQYENSVVNIRTVQLDQCPADGRCLENQVIYRASVTSENAVKTYVGSTGGTFILRRCIQASKLTLNMKSIETTQHYQHTSGN